MTTDNLHDPATEMDAPIDACESGGTLIAQPLVFESKRTLKNGIAKSLCLLIAVVSPIHILDCSTAAAQSPAPDNFNPGADGPVGSLALQRDGKILLGGLFTNVNGQSRENIARLNQDGTLDGSFAPGANNWVHSMVVQADGRILVGGRFTVLGGRMRYGIARLNPDGTLDSDFNPGASDSVYSVVVQADGKILLGGEFTSLGAQPRNCIARLNPDGTLDSGFNPSAGAGVSRAHVDCLALQADGKIVVGGHFSRLGGQSRSRIARLNPDGTLDAEFSPGADGVVYSLAVQGDGKIVVGGGFNFLGGQWRAGIARLNPNGTLDSEFKAEVNGGVFCVALQADGAILIGGSFNMMDGQPYNRIARVNPDGTPDEGFNAGTDDCDVYSLGVQEDGKVLVGGAFTTLGGQPRNSIARLNNTAPATQTLSYDDSTITWLRGGTSPEVWRTTFELSSDGLTWTSLGVGDRVTGGWQLAGVTVPADSTLRAHGDVCGDSCWGLDDFRGPPAFLSHPTNQTNHAGETATFATAAGGTRPVHFAWLKDGVTLRDGGSITGTTTHTLTVTNVLGAHRGGYSVVVSCPEGSRTSRVAQLTVIDPFISVQPRSQSAHRSESAVFTVTATGTQPLTYRWWHDGSLIADGTNSPLVLTNVQASDAGDYFVAVSNQHGSTTSSSVRLTVNLATLDETFNPGADGGIKSLAVQADGRILVGGDFITLGGRPRSRIGRLHPDGTLDEGFDVGVGGGARPQVYSLATQADGSILVGGTFTTLGSALRNNIGRLSPEGTLDADFDPGANGYISSLAVQTDGKILVGGRFTTLGGQSCNSIGRLNVDGTLDNEFNPSTNRNYVFIQCIAVQPDGKVLVGGEFRTLGGQTRTNIARLNPDGGLDSQFHPSANDLVYSLALQPDQRILVGGYFTALDGQSRHRIARLNTDGTLDAGFDPRPNHAVVSIALQADSGILLGGHFTVVDGLTCSGIARLNPDGTLDTGFNPSAGAGGFPNVYSLAMQEDGRILVGGAFTTLGGQPRHSIARLNNTAPATQTLRYDDSTITWLRGGTAPEVWRTTFEFSSDGLTWRSLGVGARVTGGWQLAGVTVPTDSTLRARGYTTGGLSSASGWFVEAYWQRHPNINIQRTGSSSFNVLLEGAYGLRCALQTTTDLVSAPEWQTVWWGALTNAPQSVSWTNGWEHGRYFRAIYH